MGVCMAAGSYSELGRRWLMMGLKVAEDNPAPDMQHSNSPEPQKTYAVNLVEFLLGCNHFSVYDRLY